MGYWHSIEIVIIAGVIFFQLAKSISIIAKIDELKSIFKSNLAVVSGKIKRENLGKIEALKDGPVFEEETEDSFFSFDNDKYVNVSLVSTQGNNRTIQNIKKALNKYLIHNYGAAVNFSIIKDIVDREVELLDDEINQSLSLPLYLGLAATMLGIIFGLLSMPSLEGQAFIEGINSLVEGVKVAMTASLVGLLLTTFLSSYFYKNANSVVQRDKNDQLSYLQSTLLPELVKAEDTGVSGLKASLDKFARKATSITNNVLKASNKTEETLQKQYEIVSKVENYDVSKISRVNIEMFDRFEKSMKAFNDFGVQLEKIGQITSQLGTFVERTADTERVIKGIESTINKSDELTRYLNSHFVKIEQVGNLALKAVGDSERHFSDSIEGLRAQTTARINELNKSSGDHEAGLKQMYSQIREDLNAVTTTYVKEFSEAYQGSIPKFDQLAHLEKINEINTLLKQMSQTTQIVDQIKAVKDNLNNVRPYSNGVNGSKSVSNNYKEEGVSLINAVKKIVKNG